jgi:hypothetical protein
MRFKTTSLKSSKPIKVNLYNIICAKSNNRTATKIMLEKINILVNFSSAFFILFFIFAEFSKSLLLTDAVSCILEFSPLFPGELKWMLKTFYVEVYPF